METTRLASLAKVVGTWTNRRSALSFLTALGLGGLDLSAADAARSGKCKPKCGKCERCDRGDCHKNDKGKKVCQKGKCKPRAFGTACNKPSGGICQNSSCICASGFTNCSDVCRNLKTDEANCGSCGTGSTATQVCQEGSCFLKGNCTTAIPSLCLPPGPDDCGPACSCGTSTEGNIVSVE